MRNLVSFALASLVLLPAAGVRAEVFPGGDGDDPGGKVGIPTVEITAEPENPQTDDILEVTITFSENVNGFEVTDLEIDGASTIGDVNPNSGPASVYTVRVRTKSDYEGDVTITVPAGVAVSDDTEEGNVAKTDKFPVDTKIPELLTATVDQLAMVLTYHEEVDDAGNPALSDFVIYVKRAEDGNEESFVPDDVDAEDDVVTLTLPSDKAILAGDTVRLDYTPGGNPLQDKRGNEAEQLRRHLIKNANILSPPDPVTDLKATGISTDTIELTWTAPDPGSSAITGYRIEVRNNASSAWGELEANTGNADTKYYHDGLTPNTTRQYQIFAINSQGRSSGSNTAPGTTKREGTVPDAPTELTAAAEGATAIRLNWDAPTNTGTSAISSYKIEVSTDGVNNFTDHATVSGTTTTYLHSGLQPNTTLHYQVLAVNATGDSEPSNTASATTGTVATVPDPPTNLVATAQGQNQINLSWTAPANDGGSAITHYRIQRSHDGNDWTALPAVNTTGDETTYSDTGLDPATTRHYRVYAHNAQGPSASPSNPHRATTAGAAPGRPTGLTATAEVRNQIDLSWNAPTDDGGSPITGYLIDFSTNGNNWSQLDSVGPNTTTYAHTGLDDGVTRHYRVAARNVVDRGSWSRSNSATTLDKPNRPRNLTATANGETQIDLSWDAPDFDGGSPITGYRIDISSNGGATWVMHVENSNSSATMYNHLNLTAGTTWHYRVFAINTIGTSSASNVAFNTTAARAPDAPTNLMATASGRTRIDLEWDPPGFDGGSPITGYRIEYSKDEGSTWTNLVANTGRTTTRYAHTGLHAGATRHYRVSAINSVGAGDPSNTDSATTAPNVPGPPQGLAAAATGMTSIDLSWSPPASDSGSAITGYRIEVSNTGTSGWSVLAANTGSTDTGYSHTGLTPDTTLHYRVKAINGVGPGAPSNVDRATTDPRVPDAPDNLTATADGQSRINLRWSPPGYDGGSPVTGYRIEVSANGGGSWSPLVNNTNTVATSYVHRGLAPGTTRHYRVHAINVAGTGAASDIAHATTDAVVPASPTDLEAMADGPFQIDLSWVAPTYDGGSPITGYRIEVSTTRGATWRTLEENTGSTSTAYSHMNLPAATRRDYRVSALNAVGRSLPSNVAHATTDPDLPDAPTDLRAMARGTSQIELEWMAPDYTGGVSISGYRIEVSEDGGSRWTVLEANVPSTPTSYTHMDLDPATTRHYRVAATNAAGTGDPSNVASATTDATTPDAPADLTATADGTSRIDLAWTAPDYDGGAGVTGYRIEVSVNRGVTWTDLEANTQSTSTTYAHTGLSPATTRHYRVSAINRIGAGDPSESAHATTDATVPDAPQRLTAAAHDHSQIDLDWGAPDFDGGSAITGYRIEVSENEGSSWADLVANTGSAETEYSHTGLDPATTRHYRVSAINAIGTGDASNVANATTDAVVPDRPTNLVATATEPTRIDLNWSAPAYDGGAPIGSYRIEVSQDGVNWTDLQRSTGTTLTSYAHVGLKPGSTRHYRVSAINVAGTGLPSNPASASTDDPVERAGRVNEAILPHFAAAATTSTMAAISGRIEAVAARNPLRSQLDAAGLLSRAGNMGLRGSAGGLNMARLFDGKSFALPLGGDGQQEDIATPVGFTTWGSAEYTSMGEPDGEDVEWDGDMLSIHIGADARVHRDILAGLVGSRSAGNYDFTDVTGEREVEGTYEARMTSLNPYVAWLPGRKGVAVWAAGSFGWGEVTVDDEPGGQRASDTRSRAGAVGGSRIMMMNGASALRLRAEGWMSQVEVDGSEAMDALTLDMQRLRLAVEWSQVQRLSGGQEVNLVVEGGLRYGDGDGTEGTGMELGGGLRFISGTGALTVEGHGRLLATSPNDYEEWGFRGLIQIEPQAVARGLSLKITPAWGQSASGVQELYEQGVGNRPDMGSALQKGRVNTRVEYGLGEFSGTPYGRFYLADGGARAFGTGMQYSVTRVLDLRFEGTRTESANGPVRHGLAMRGRWVF